MRSDVDPKLFLSKVFQLRYELDGLGETATDERLTTIILDALPEEMDSTVRTQSVKDPDLGLEEIIGMLKAIFINHPEMSSVPKRSQASCRKVWSNGREPGTDNVCASAMTLTCHHYCKKPGHKKKHCKELLGKSDKPSNVENDTKKWCSYHHSNRHSNEDCYQQHQSGKTWCTYHKKKRNPLGLPVLSPETW